MKKLSLFIIPALLIVTSCTAQITKYNAAIKAVQSQDHPRSVKLLKKLIAEPYIQNSVYKESDVYELLAHEYQQMGDSLSYVETLRTGFQKFPGNKYFMPSLVNEFIRNGKTADAIAYLDLAIANDPDNFCNLMSAKGSLYIYQQDYAQAESAYQAAINSNANCEKALDGLGVLYILQAQDLKEKAELDKTISEQYLKALPYLEKYYELLNTRNADDYEKKAILMKLQNVYYNLCLLNIDKSAELEAIEDALRELSGE